MTQPRSMELGPYLLVRPLARPNLRIYTVHPKEQPEVQEAVLWKVEAPEYHIPAEWRIRCVDCPEAPSPSRAESISKAFYDRDRALAWLRRHRLARHPSLAPKEDK